MIYLEISNLKFENENKKTAAFRNSNFLFTRAGSVLLLPTGIQDERTASQR